MNTKDPYYNYYDINNLATTHSNVYLNTPAKDQNYCQTANKNHNHQQPITSATNKQFTNEVKNSKFQNQALAGPIIQESQESPIHPYKGKLVKQKIANYLTTNDTSGYAGAIQSGVPLQHGPTILPEGMMQRQVYNNVSRNQIGISSGIYENLENTKQSLFENINSMQAQ
jgi:hypothetical protein